MTAAEVMLHRPGLDFFVDLTDTTTNKCYGIQIVKNKDVEPTRVLGYYGAITRRFEAPFLVLRGAREIAINASPAKPIECTEHLYPLG